MDTKPIFKSKTAAFGFLTAVAGAAAFFFPGVEEYVSENAAGILFVIGVLSVALRKVTKGKVTLVPLLLMGLCLGSLGLVSCGGVGLPVSATPDGCVQVCKDFESGRKACVKWCLDGRKSVEFDEPQLDGSVVKARAVYRADGTYSLEYMQEGLWVSYDPSAKNPLVIGPPPGEQGDPVPPAGK